MNKLILIAVLATSAGSSFSAPLWSNGPYLTGSGDGYAGANTSTWTVFDTSSGPVASNIGCNNSYYRVIEDFEIASGQQWKLDQFVSYAFRSTSSSAVPPPSTFNSAYVAIYTSDPIAGSAPVFGDFVTNRYQSSGWTGAYRVSSSNLTDYFRPIMEVRADLSFVPTLGSGKYWIEYGLKTTSATSAVYAVGVSPVLNGNAYQRQVSNNQLFAWAPVETAFELHGSAVPEPSSIFAVAGGFSVLITRRARQMRSRKLIR
ncbi:MAG: PEP-CTERM sorting domain-containing protein [Armatimonadetes bacterium]|nr:PEP-CTERM sorting domain-containing protein [Armatimonadota bacterium]